MQKIKNHHRKKGECNACEPVQEDSSQDWSIFKTDEPTAINPIDTASRC